MSGLDFETIARSRSKSKKRVTETKTNAVHDGDGNGGVVVDGNGASGTSDAGDDDDDDGDEILVVKEKGVECDVKDYFNGATSTVKTDKTIKGDGLLYNDEVIASKKKAFKVTERAMTSP